MYRILWIEDEGKIELSQFATPLRRAGYLVDIAADAAEAIRLLKEKRYDALIIDLVLPPGTGFETEEYYVGLELLRQIIHGEIKGISVYKPSQIMVFTVINDPGIHKRIRSYGVDRILHKRLTELTELKNWVDGILLSA
jgi:CheY-like chemotaxis protein